MPLRRRTFSAGLLCSIGAPAVQASTQPGSYPTKPIRLIVPLAAGSAVDNAARVLCQKMGQQLGQSFVIENQPGSAGLIGAERVARASPDGYTMGGFNDSILTMVPHIYPKVGWNALTDFVPVSLVGTIEWGIVVKPDAPYRTLGEFVAAAKAAPGKLTFGSGGNGSPQHLAMAMFASRAGISLMHVPYRGATPAGLAVATGEVDIGFQGLGTINALVQAGKLRLLAASAPQRLSQYPEVPTVSESGFSGFLFNSWFAMVAPKGTPKSIVQQLHKAIALALKDESTRQQLTAQGLTIQGTTPEAFVTALREQYDRYQKVIQTSSITAD
ncbi:Bug family tripartite tricarboxylate transporter substrate binding protein [Comamonas sp. UBA7528]|uniref:Bug family tripartite tricarboxylate transporter substrate binding protein n=1 Tax=Comamonas sp. UBA7528 TaxID=1946391 RepID=UPI0025B91361|nr:tripartite tricarboxylate transporter substrate binding protein [Comamonas sp. UBA7528]